jgi:integrase
VPLSDAAQEIVDRAGQYSDSFLFPNFRNGHITEQAMAKVLKKHACEGTIHGFRTTFRTWVQDTDACSWEVAETILGHTVGGKVERAYARSDLLERRRMVMQNWAGFVTNNNSNVVHVSPLLKSPQSTTP